MKRAKQMKLLLGILAVVSIMAFAVLSYQEKQEDIQNSDEVILQIDADSVTELSWTYDDTSLSFHKETKWQYDDDEAFPVDAEKIKSLLSYFSEMGAAFVIEDAEDLTQYGLDDPECSVYIHSNDKDYEIAFGDYSIMDAQRYVSIGDGNVYLVNSDPLAAFQVELSDMIDNDDIPTFDRVDSISFSGSENYEVIYKEYSEDSTDTICSEDIYYKKENETLLPLDTENVELYLDTISGMSEDSYVTYNASEENLAIYGLDDPELTVDISYSDDDENEEETTKNFTLHISRDAETKQTVEENNGTNDESDNNEEVSDNEEKTYAYARIGNSKIIYEISETSFDALMAASYDDLRHKNLFTGDFSDISQIDVELDGKQYSINVESDGDENTYLYNDKEIDITDLRTALEAVSATSFINDASKDDQELSLTLHFSNETNNTMSLTFYRYDGENCLAEVNGKITALVSRSAVIDLSEAINAIVL